MRLRDGRLATGRPQPFGHGAVIATIASGIFVLSGYVVNVWLGRLLGPNDYGRFGVVIGLLTVLNIIQTAAVPQAVARFAAEDPASAEGALRRGAELQLTMALALTLALALGAPAIARALGDDGLVGLLWVAALVLLPYGLLTLLIGFHGGRRLFTRQALTQASYAITKAVGAIGLAYGFRLPGALAGYVVAASVGVVVGWHRVWRGRSTVSYRQLIAIAGPLSVYAIASTAHMTVDIFFVKALVGTSEIPGYYAASQNVARIPFYLVAGFAAIVLPIIAAAAQRGRSEAAHTASRSLRWSLVIVLPITAIILATSTPLVELLYSSRYSPAGEILALLGPAMGILALSSVAAGLISGLGRPVVAASVAVLGLVFTVVACAILVPLAGVWGAALSTLSGSAVVLVIMTVTLWRSVPGSVPLSSLGRVGLAAGMVGVVAWVLAPEGMALVVAYMAFGLAVVGLLVATREVTVDELRGLLRLHGDGGD